MRAHAKRKRPNAAHQEPRGERIEHGAKQAALALHHTLHSILLADGHARHALHLETDSVRVPWLQAVDQALQTASAPPFAAP